jgi:ribosome-associated protein
MNFGEQSQRMTTETKQQTRIYVQTAAAVCEDKKGVDTRILELDPIDSGLSDFFLITSATNDRQAIAIADEIEDRLKKNFGVFPNAVEGRRQGQWILLDYVDFVVHVFLADRRAFYDIERLRKSARPLTPAEFDAELKAELAARTVAARQKAAAKPEPAKAAPSPKPKKAVMKKAVKSAARKSKTVRPAAKKPAAKKKVAGKKAQKPAIRKATTKKSAAKKASPRKPAPKKKKR